MCFFNVTSGEFERGQQKDILPFPFVDPICEIAMEWHNAHFERFKFNKLSAIDTNRTPIRHTWFFG